MITRPLPIFIAGYSLKIRQRSLNNVEALLGNHDRSESQAASIHTVCIDSFFW